MTFGTTYVIQYCGYIDAWTNYCNSCGIAIQVPPGFACYYSTAHMYEGCTESHEQLFLHANWEQQTKESTVVDGTSCYVILECLVTSIACIM